MEYLNQQKMEFSGSCVFGAIDVGIQVSRAMNGEIQAQNLNKAQNLNPAHARPPELIRNGGFIGAQGMASINGVMGVQWLPEINVTPKAPPIITNINMQVECINKPVEAIQRGYQGNVSAHQVFDKIPQNCSSDFHLYHHDYGGNVHNLGKQPYWSSYYSNPFPQPSYQHYQNPYNAYTSCLDSSNWHGYGSTQYPGCGNSYQHQSHSYSQLVGANQKACGPYQSSPLTQETRYFTGSEIYSGSYKNSSDCQTIGMATYVKPPTPTGSKDFLVMQKQKEEPLGIERLHGGEIVRVELQELGKGHMGTNEGFANKNVNAGMLEESGFTGLVKAGVGIEEVKKTKDAQNLIPERSYDVNWKSGVRNGQEWLGINVIPETPNLMPNVGGCYKDKSEWAKVKYARDYIGKEEIKEQKVCEDCCSPQTKGNKTELFKLVLDNGHDQCVEGSSFYNLEIDEGLMAELSIVESTIFKSTMLQLLDKVQTAFLDSPFEETDDMVKLLFPKLTFQFWQELKLDDTETIMRENQWLKWRNHNVSSHTGSQAIMAEVYAISMEYLSHP